MSEKAILAVALYRLCSETFSAQQIFDMGELITHDPPLHFLPNVCFNFMAASDLCHKLAGWFIRRVQQTQMQ